MLGTWIDDPGYVESSVQRRQGLGLLPVTTTFLSTKETHQIKGNVIANRGLLSEAQDVNFEGYEIHMGRTETDGGGDVFRIWEHSGQSCDISDGYLDASGHVLGTYIHGLFHNQKLRQTILKHIARAKGRPIDFISSDRQRDDEYDKLAQLIRNSLNMDLLYDITGLRKGR